MFEVDWDDWSRRKEFKEKQRQKRKSNLRKLLESDLNLNKTAIITTLSKMIQIQGDDDYWQDISDLMEEALMKIADGCEYPQQVAIDTLKKMCE